MQRIIFFDGICQICNAFTKIILKIDHRNLFVFADLKSEAARRHLQSHLDVGPDSVVYYENGRIYTKSTAILKIALQCRQPFPVIAGALLKLPTKYLDMVYDFIARHRHRFFKPYQICPPVPHELKNRFLR